MGSPDEQTRFGGPMPLNRQVRAARDFLLQHRTDYDTAYQNFTWPELSDYNFALDWFDGLAEENPNGIALWVIDSEGEQQRTFRELADNSVAAAHLLASGRMRVRAFLIAAVVVIRRASPW
jgi:hypothetical protein